MVSARYLGPSNYGLLNYAASLVAFALPFMKLGFDSTLVKELVESPSQEGEIMGTALIMNTLSGVLCMAAVSTFAFFTNLGDQETILVCVLYSISLIFSALEMIQYWFQYKLLSKYSSVVMLVSYFVVSCYKIYLLAASRSVLWFAVSNSLDYGIIAVSLLIIYRKHSEKPLKWSKDLAKKMLSRSKYYVLASLMLVVLQNTDHIMLTGMIDKAENGYYSAAITCATVTQFVYVAIVDSFRPMILVRKKESQRGFENSMMQLYSLTLWLGIAQVAVFILAAKPITLLLYGKSYLPTVKVLRCLMVYFVFSLMGLLRNVWILAEQKQKYLPIINLSGAVMNILLNAFLIPLWGACGAAVASVVTQFFANFVMGYILKPLRENNRLIIKSLNPVLFAKMVREYGRSFKNAK